MKHTEKLLFTLACVVAVAAQTHFKLDATAVGLILLGLIPWLAPLLAPYVTTLKFAGMEVALREMKAQVEESKQVAQAAVSAAVAGVGRAPGEQVSAPVSKSEYVDHGVPMPPKNESLDSEEEEYASDPNRGMFGGKAETSGRKLCAEVKPLPGSTDFFRLHIWVAASAGAPPLADGTRVKFHLHPTFRPMVTETVASAGVATLDRVAWGAFTVGAEVDGVQLELNLATDIPAPDLFRKR